MDLSQIVAGQQFNLFNLWNTHLAVTCHSDVIGRVTHQTFAAPQPLACPPPPLPTTANALQSCPCALPLCLNLKCNMKSNPAAACTCSR
jgi:hypothetical protein